MVHRGVIVLVALWSSGAISQSVFQDRPQAHMLLRHKRANSFLEEIKPPSKERECVEEVCDFEEAREIFQTREATIEFWVVYTDGNQCEPNPCVNGSCVDQFKSFTCKCNQGFEGKLCDHNVTATSCRKDNGDCKQVCTESANGTSRTCSCVRGYSLDLNSRSCSPNAKFACGRVHIPRSSSDVNTNIGLMPWVVGGERGKKGESPWQVMLLNEKGNLHCGGVLISESWVLTAAHCLEGEPHLSVRLGEYDRTIKEGTEVTLAVAETISHPNYNTESVDNDIALLRLASPVSYTTYIAPVCLPSHNLAENILHRNGTSTIVTGWGRKTYQGPMSLALRYISIPVVEPELCADVMPNEITENMLCGGILGHEQDACNGDSGGPMVTKYHNTWFLIGLVSLGDRCGQKDRLGIYTKVANYLDWIESTQKTRNKP
ncbi:vitamin K-dependent protein C [Brienomyrus brachyistius]|uniref:vitamin K-dependent protein C n=1 Tax=Brienomyrus brachyistius TaxID=42636 RepID=UPI0020B253E8|nr:vitamin K-dependent protein C [Brienomyrus brachyistius]